jgi:hypothetical protein
VWLRIAASAALFIFSNLALAQTVSRAYAGSDRRVHIVFASGKTRTVSPEDHQVGCEKVAVAADRRTVGWSVLYENCCTSYPIPTAVVTVRNDKKSYISSPQMVHNWHFVGRGEQVALLFGPVHGNPSGVNLYDTASGKLLHSWFGKGYPPSCIWHGDLRGHGRLSDGDEGGGPHRRESGQALPPPSPRFGAGDH